MHKYLLGYLCVLVPFSGPTLLARMDILLNNTRKWRS